MMAIDFKQFSFSYRGKTKALTEVTLAIPQGSFTVITGPCGAGKTTLCMAINGLVPHYFGGSVSGEALIDGQNSLNCRVSDLALRVGTVMEDFESQLVTMTVADEIAFGLENRGIDRVEIGRRTTEVLTLVGLKGMETREVASLSGGQKQRLAIAAVLVTEADILVLDEPASALDPEGAEELYSLLSHFHRTKGLTIVVVEHELARVLPYADQLVVMSGGRVEKAGLPAETLAYMYGNSLYMEGVPALSELKFTLENLISSQFSDWRTEREAAADLSGLLSRKRLEVSKSA